MAERDWNASSREHPRHGVDDPSPVPGLTLPAARLEQQPGSLQQYSDAVQIGMRRSAGYVGAVTREHNLLAVVALVLSAVGVVTFVCAPIGAVLGHVARRQIHTRGQANRGMATAAIVLGWGVVTVYSVGLLCTATFILIKGAAVLGTLFG
jgi:hypothetical protein